MDDFFDTHVHLDADPFRRSLEAEVEAARNRGVTSFLVPGVSRKGWRDILAIARSVNGAYAAPGVHPLAAQEWNGDTASDLERLLTSEEVVAVGEIGLDALIPAPVLEVQEMAFREQLRIAVDANLPVLIHCRRASGRLLKILKEERASKVGGIFHAFSGSVETAIEAIRLGFAIGFGGPLTYPGARRGPEVAGRVPAESIVLETDAPDLPPHPHRGEINHPAYIPLVASELTRIRGWSLEETARITTCNARRILRLEDN